MFAVNVRKKKIIGNSKNKNNDRQIFVFVFSSKSQTSPKKERKKRMEERRRMVNIIVDDMKKEEYCETATKIPFISDIIMVSFVLHYVLFARTDIKQ